MNGDKKKAPVAVIAMPGAAALKCVASDSDIPRVTAHIETKVCGAKEWQECELYVGAEPLARMTVFRGKAFAVKMLRQALKGAVSRLGYHRRKTANKRARAAAAAAAEEREAVKEAENAFI